MENTTDLLDQIDLGNLPDTVWMDNLTQVTSDGDDGDDIGIASCSSETCRAEDTSKVVSVDPALESNNLSLNKLISRKETQLV